MEIVLNTFQTLFLISFIPLMFKLDTPLLIAINIVLFLFGFVRWR